ncbi:unnamed protein product [Amoebophrya sp. A25]|nr:unnamed protein product [Amoebophrya sp. A25]|eukprot:GSA25T00019927001.1
MAGLFLLLCSAYTLIPAAFLCARRLCLAFKFITWRDRVASVWQFVPRWPSLVLFQFLLR